MLYWLVLKSRPPTMARTKPVGGSTATSDICRFESLLPIALVTSSSAAFFAAAAAAAPPSGPYVPKENRGPVVLHLDPGRGLEEV